MPSTTVKWYDQSAFEQNTPNEIDNSPLFLVFSSFDRGPEDLRVTSGQEFFKLYGEKMNFERHGQPAIQAANIINGGGRILVKRLVAKDATLANAIVTATVSNKISAIKAEDDDPNGKTINEILGKPDEPVDYVDQLTIISSIGSTDNSTVLQVEPALTSGNKYFWYPTSSDMALEVGTDVSDYDEWDGTGELAIDDGTKIALVEADADGGALKAGVITVVSKIAHPNTTSTEPTNTLPALYITSTDTYQNAQVGYTSLVVSPAKADPANKYFYTDGIDYLDPSVVYDDSDLSTWTEWDGTSPIEKADGDVITLVEVSVTTDQTTSTDTYAAVKGASIAVCTTLAPDDRTSESIDLVIPTNNKYIVSTEAAIIRWDVSAVSNCKNIEDVREVAEEMYVDNDPEVKGEDNIVITDSTTFPVFFLVDNGRGESNKSFRFVADRATSKDLGNIYYNIFTYVGNTAIESTTGCINPSVILNGVRYGLNNDTSSQLVYDTIDGVYDDMISYLSELTGVTESELKRADLFTGVNYRGSAIPKLTLDPESQDLGSTYGLPVDGGSNGEFGDKPFGTQAWADAAIELLNGSYDNIIFDVDVYRLSAAFDANYPFDVKEALAELVNFREDFFYFRDYGLDVSSYSSIVEYYHSFDKAHYTRYIGDYYTTYMIYDPETRIRERVTMMYDFARVAASRLSVAAHLPLAGFANSMILSNAIKNTINFTPRRTPQVDQKALLDDLRLNYAIFEDDNCIVQSLYTSQKEYTQLSFSNNVIAIQETVRSVRRACPKQRFTFASGSDFTSYANAVNAVLQGFRSNFSTLKFSYEKDALKASQKIFYATITYSFHNWAKDEHFDLFAIGTEE